MIRKYHLCLMLKASKVNTESWKIKGFYFHKYVRFMDVEASYVASGPLEWKYILRYDQEY